MTAKLQTSYEESSRLLARTARTVGVLVAAAVLFVGALSTAAVLVTNKAVGVSPAAAEPIPSAPSLKKTVSI